MSATIASWFVAVGASLGSFLNVVAYRLPLGRTVGGHSGCPYCCSSIQRSDNVPVLAWLKLRGRCRTCRLPISAQYPLVEFLVAMIFLFVFFTEVARGGANLPSDRTASQFPLFQLTVTPTLVMRLVSYATIMCGLVAAGLIAVKRQPVPIKLFAWSLLPLVVSVLVEPRVMIVQWRSTAQLGAPLGPIEDRLHAVISIGLGLSAAALIGWMTGRLMVRGSRKLRTWVAGLAVAGALLGWQAAIPMTAVLIVCWLLMQFSFRGYSDRLAIDDPAVWMWLGLLVFRAIWRPLDELQLLPSSLPELGRYTVGLAALLVTSWLAWFVRRPSVPPPHNTPVPDTPFSDQPLSEQPALSQPTHTEKTHETLT